MPKTVIKVKCVWCHAELERTLGHYNQAKRRGSQFTCIGCRARYRNAKVLGMGKTILLVPCAACGCAVEKTWGTIKKRWLAGGRTFFCGRSCASLYSRGGKRAKTSFPPRLIPNHRPYG